MKHFIILVMAAALASSCAEPVFDERAVTYWQDDACARVLLPELDRRAGWDFCVEKVVVTEGALEYHVRWTSFGPFGRFVDKLSDNGNENLYVVDDRGNRYDHVAMRGAALTATRLDHQLPSAPGVFVFPLAAPDATSFTFRDDDQGVATTPIRFDADARTDRAASLERLVGVLETSSITIDSEWSGLGAGVEDELTIERTGGEFRLKRSEDALPELAVARFLATLATAPILKREYEPTFTHTDDYPFVGISVGTPMGVVSFGSSSQGAGMVPWYVDVGGTRFVIPDDTPARALQHIADHIPDFDVRVRDRRPGLGVGVTSTGDTELVEAVRSHDPLRVRELIARVRDVEERSPYDGATAVGATAAGDAHDESLVTEGRER